MTRREALRALAGAGVGLAAARLGVGQRPVVAAEEEGRQGMETIKRRLREGLLTGNAPTAEARGHLQSLRADGSWADVPYADADPTNWRAMAHLSRLSALVRAYRLPGEMQGSPELNRGILSVLDHWLARDYQNRNWWYNVIGAPMALAPVLLLMEGELSPEQMRGGLRVLERAKLGMTGQNLVWVAGLTIRRGCLAGDAAAVREAFERVAAEVRVTTEEGIQPDYSFHQHGAQLYSGGYGRGFSIDVPRLAWLAHGTEFELPEEKRAILAAYLLEGPQWMIRGRTFDYSAIGREIARPRHSASGIGEAAATMARVYPTRRAELEALARRLSDPSPKAETALQGNRHFRRSDFMAHHRPGYYASVRMASTRLQRTEIINNENLKGHHLADGVSYLYGTGDEYRDIFAVWDWQRLPGTTCEQGAPPIPPAHGTTTFVGGVSDGTYGMAACDFASGPLTARNAWFFFDRE